MTALGGTTVLTEVPEMFGAETILMGRAKDETVFRKDRLDDQRVQSVLQSARSGHLRQSLPRKQGRRNHDLGRQIARLHPKGGTGIVVDVLGPHRADCKTKGLNLISAPGQRPRLDDDARHVRLSDWSSSTTGRGTPFGGFIPTFKISSNTDIAKRKPNWIDFNAGRLVDGDDPDQRLGRLDRDDRRGRQRHENQQRTKRFP
ncbi:MAG: UxaA family hydrolase [Bacillus subtilis]|nr:UxaA family hydrolase [Bacillus subtilis]